MLFNMSGFVVGLLVARQNKLSQAQAVTIGAVASAMGGMNGMGIVVASALAQRQASTTASSGGTSGNAPPPALPTALLDPPTEILAESSRISEQQEIVTLGWDAVPGAKGYQITRLHHHSKTAVVVTLSYPTSLYLDPLPTDANATNYSYRVATLNSDEKPGPLSKRVKVSTG